MYFVLIMALLGQADTDVTVQQQREWLIANLTVDLNFDEEKIADAEQKINRLPPEQVRLLVQFYKKRKADVEKQNQDFARQLELRQQTQQQIYASKIETYKRHLAREAQYQSVVRQQELELLRRANVYQRYVIQNFSYPQFYGVPYRYGYNPYPLYPYRYGYNPYRYYNWRY